MSLKRVVIKCGGNSLAQRSALLPPLTQLKNAGYQVVLVHGGGSAINQLSQQLNIPQHFSNGLRITSSEMLAVAQMVLIGKINCDLVRYLNQLNFTAIDLSGCDANLLLAEYIDKQQLGEVGEVYQVNLALLDILLTQHYIPVIAPLAAHTTSGTLNINADSAAASIAIALGASHLILLSDIEGYYANYPDPDTLLTTLSPSEISALLSQKNQVSAGMYPKLKAAYHAVSNNVAHVHIMHAKRLNQLWEVIEQQLSIGTHIVKEQT